MVADKPGTLTGSVVCNDTANLIQDNATTTTTTTITTSLADLDETSTNPSGQNACNGGSVTIFASSEPQRISSPGYPGGYPPNQICQWTIHNQDGFHIKLRIHEFEVTYEYFIYFALTNIIFQLEQSKDYLYITEDPPTDPPFEYILSGTTYHGISKYRSSRINIVFTSDISYSRAGFNMSIEMGNYCV